MMPWSKEVRPICLFVGLQEINPVFHIPSLILPATEKDTSKHQAQKIKIHLPKFLFSKNAFSFLEPI